MITTLLTWCKKRKIELLLFFLAFSVRFLYALFIQRLFGEHVFISFSDAAVYLRMAHNLLDYHTLSQAMINPDLLPDPLWMPLYPLFLALLLTLKMPLIGMIIVQDILAGGIVVMIYRLGIRIFNAPLVGAVAAIMYAVEPMSLYWNTLLMTENLSNFLFLAAIFLFVEKKYYFSAIIIGLAALARPINAYLFPIFLIMFVYLYRTQWSWSMFKKIVLITLLFFMTIFPWLLRNKIQFDHWDLSTDGWYAMYYFTGSRFAEIEHEPYRKVPYDFPAVSPSFYPGPERAVYYYIQFSFLPMYRDYMIGLIARHPVDYLRFHVASSIQGFNNHDYEYIMKYVLLAKKPDFNRSLGTWLVHVGQIMWYAIYGFVVLGFLIKGKRDWLFFLISFYLANNFLTGYISTVSAGGRYNLPYMPLTLLAASYGLIYGIRYVRSKIFRGSSATR